MPVFKKSIIFKTAIIVIFFVTVIAVFGLAVKPVLAQISPSLGIEYGSSINLGTRDIREIVMTVIQILLGFLGLIAIGIVLYGGWLWMTSQGEPDKIERAKKVLINGAIGLLIILLAYAIVWFIAREISRITTGGGGGGGGYTLNGGALGGGVLEAVYPEPGATGIPRNTMIMVMFNEQMNVETIIKPGTGNITQCIGVILPCGYISYPGNSVNNPNVKIKNLEDNTILLADQVVVMASADYKNYVFNPIPYLGNADNFSYYSVNLSDNIERGNGLNAFLGGGYTWLFQVSNVLDLDPPHVTEVIPRTDPGETVFMNAVIQINFNEAVNIVGATMWQNIAPFYDGSTATVTGSLVVSNLFKTVEFVSAQLCPMPPPPAPQTNSCGVVPFCLPANNSIATLIKAALVNPQTHETINPLSGVTDAAGNSLDGGEDNVNTSGACTLNNVPSSCSLNGQADGSPTANIPVNQSQVLGYWQALTNISVPNDNFWWIFDTNDQMDLDPPVIVEVDLPNLESPANQLSLDPRDEQMLVPKNKYLKAVFDEYMRSSTLTSSNYKVFNEQLCLPGSTCNVMTDNQDWPDEIAACDYDQAGTCLYPRGGFVVTKQNYSSLATANLGILNDITKAQLKTYYPYLDGLQWYNPRILSDVQDAFQNCFNPAEGPAPTLPANH
jgi:hypothetical protein